MEEFEIVEDGNSFKENALIKARAVFNALKRDDIVVMADDSGISVDVLDGSPGIYSARHAGKDANDKDNLNKLIQDIKAKGATSSPAHYTAAIAIVTKKGSMLYMVGCMERRLVRQEAIKVLGMTLCLSRLDMTKLWVSWMMM